MIDDVNVADYVTKLYLEFKEKVDEREMFRYFLGQADDYQMVSDCLKKNDFKGYEPNILSQAYKDTLEMYR